MVQRGVTRQPPIGYWLKHADEVITTHVDQVLSDQRFTRFRWQVLNIIYEESTITRREVQSSMQAFIDAHQLDEIITGFTQEGWLVRTGDHDAAELALTAADKTQRDTIFSLQSGVRRRATKGITDQEHMTVVSVLQRMVANLEEAP